MDCKRKGRSGVGSGAEGEGLGERKGGGVGGGRSLVRRPWGAA